MPDIALLSSLNGLRGVGLCILEVEEDEEPETLVVDHSSLAVEGDPPPHFGHDIAILITSPVSQGSQHTEFAENNEGTLVSERISSDSTGSSIMPDTSPISTVAHTSDEGVSSSTARFPQFLVAGDSWSESMKISTACSSDEPLNQSKRASNSLSHVQKTLRIENQPSGSEQAGLAASATLKAALMTDHTNLNTAAAGVLDCVDPVRVAFGRCMGVPAQPKSG